MSSQGTGVDAASDRTSRSLYASYFKAVCGEAVNVDDELHRAAVTFRKFYAPHVPGGVAARILDVGCGFGKVLWGARECGFGSITGVDISDDQVEFASAVLRLPVERCDALVKLESVRGELDCVLLIWSYP
jgi:2-polyprenyl-3-methyl-5-hydroxy-6-metoxy-1,4-benzoquinol methylase